MLKQTVSTIIKEGRRGTGKKEPLKESSFEMYVWIQKEKEVRKTNRAIKQLKKEGKLQSIAGFLVCNEGRDEVDEWINSKRDKFNRKRLHSRKKNVNDEEIEDPEDENKKPPARDDPVNKRNWTFCEASHAELLKVYQEAQATAPPSTMDVNNNNNNNNNPEHI